MYLKLSQRGAAHAWSVCKLSYLVASVCYDLDLESPYPNPVSLREKEKRNNNFVV